MALHPSGEIGARIPLAYALAYALDYAIVQMALYFQLKLKLKLRERGALDRAAQGSRPTAGRQSSRQRAERSNNRNS